MNEESTVKRFDLRIVACILSVVLAGAGCAAVAGADAGMLAGKEYEKHELKDKDNDNDKKENGDKTQ